MLAALVVNARMLLYSAALAPHAAGWPARWRWLGAYLLADPVYALAITRFTGAHDATARASGSATTSPSGWCSGPRGWG